MPGGYIGITGFTTPQEVTAVMEAWPDAPNKSAMIGVLASSNTLKGRQNRWPHRYPTGGQIKHLFSDHAFAFNVIHYNTEEPETLLSQLERLVELGGPNLHGFQLNMPWPSLKVLELFRRQRPDLAIIFQMRTDTLSMVGNRRQRLVARLSREYSELIDYVLLDLSAGLGRPLDTPWAREFLNALVVAERGWGVGVAGGLSPATLHLVHPLIEEFPNLSIDAESQLRNRTDFLDVSLAKDYIGRALKMFGN